MFDIFKKKKKKISVEPSLYDWLNNMGEPVKEINGALYIATHKEFNKNHHVIITEAGPPKSLEECQEWCDKTNRNGHKYKPYEVKS